MNGTTLKLHKEDLNKKQDDMFSVREKVLYKLTFEKFAEENPASADNDDDNDDDKSE